MFSLLIVGTASAEADLLYRVLVPAPPEAADHAARERPGATRKIILSYQVVEQSDRQKQSVTECDDSFAR